nr:response regulator [Spirochaetales bacterium]
ILADDGKQALTLLEEVDDIAIILMDLQMPVIDGLKATQLIRQNPKTRDMIVIALTAHSIAGDREKCIKVGMDDYVPKPIDQKFLYKTLSKYLACSEEIITPSPSSHISESSLELPDQIAGINLKSGITRLNHNVEFYVKLLHDFHVGYHDAGDTIDTLLADQQLAQVQLLVHTIKGMAANLAAYDLEKASQTVEGTIKHGEEVSKAMLQTFRGALAIVIDSIETIPVATFQPQQEEEKTATQLDYKDVAAQIKELHTMLATNDLDAEAAIDTLLIYAGTHPAFASPLRSIQQKLNTFDFGGALPITKELLEVAEKLIHP